MAGNCENSKTFPIFVYPHPTVRYFNIFQAMKRSNLLILVSILMWIGTGRAMAQTANGNSSDLCGIWQMCFYVSNSPEIPYRTASFTVYSMLVLLSIGHIWNKR